MMTGIFLADANPADSAVDLIFKSENGQEIGKEGYYLVALDSCNGQEAANILLFSGEHLELLCRSICIQSFVKMEPASSRKRGSTFVKCAAHHWRWSERTGHSSKM